MTLRSGGGAIVALQTGLHTFDFDSGALEFIVHPEEGQPQARLNDGKVDRDGRFVVGSMDMGEERPIGSLYRLDAEMQLETLARGFAISNGPSWSVDGKRLYFSDSTARKIYRYSYGDEGLGPRQVFHDLSNSVGLPDGATVDADDCLWFAEVFGGRIWRLSPAGEILLRIDMPVLKITSLCFGGDGLQDLFVTSMAKPPLPKYPEDGELAGSLFVITGMQTTGLPEQRFLG
jgi:hypothetical protein